MEWIQWIFGMALILTGLVLVVKAALRFWRENGQAIQGNVRQFAEEREARAQAVAEEKVAQQVEAARAVEVFEPASFRDGIGFEGIALRQSGRDQHYDLETWARMIAWLIYSRLIPSVPGHVGVPLGPTMFKSRVDEPDKLARFSWVRIFADEAVCQEIRTYYNLSPAQLDESLRKALLNVLEAFFDIPCHERYSELLVVNLFERDKRRETTFDVDFLPLLPEARTQPCDAYLMLASGLGQIRIPGAKDHKLQFGDQILGLQQGYFPLSGDAAGLIEIGPSASCHIQTGKQFCAGSLVLGWREANEVGVGGILEVRDVRPVKSESFFLRHLVEDEQRDDLLVANTRTRLATRDEGTQTTCEIWRRLGPHDNLLMTLVLRNRRPPLDSLPDCVIFENAFASFHSARDFAAFLASQIYFATKRQKNEIDILRLDSPEGQAFFADPREGGAIFNRGRKREPLRCRLRLCLPPARLNQVHEWLGDRDMTSRLAAAILDVIREEPDFKSAFPAEALLAFKAGEGTPGLSVDIGSDAALDANTVLLRALPVFVPNRRREIYGRLHFSGWAGARDRSDFSCSEGLTFFTDYPSGTVALYLSRFPVYEVQAPGVFGAIKIHITEPGTPGARLRVDNHSATHLLVDGKPLQRPSSATVELAGKGDATVTLKAGEREAEVIVYAKALAQLEEPMFVPEPAKLELHGLALHRRLERTGWDSSRAFVGLWDAAAIHEGKELRGISQVTAQGYLAVVERGARIEHHFFAGRKTELEGELRLSLKPGNNTLAEQALPGQVKIWENEAANVQVDYLRLDFARHRIANASVLTCDYWDYWIEELEQVLPAGERVSRVELARCCAALEKSDEHLYLVETSAGDDLRRGWLWHKPAGITAVRLRSGLASLLPCDGPLVGPLPDIAGTLFLVDWSEEQATPVSFDLPDHEEQIRHYLADGFVTLPEDASFQVGGKLAGDTRTHKSADPLYISGKPLSLHYEAEASPSRPCLNFNPRDYANFFDKDSYRIYYSGEKRSFVIEAEAHRKENITPKTVFMIIPEGGHAILGSHALSPVKIPVGVNTIVLPGLVFKLSQGPVYYA